MTSLPPSSTRRIALAALAALSGLVVSAPQTVAHGITQSDDRTAYVLLSAGSRSSSMSGSTEDLRRARSLRSGQEGLLYVRQDGAAYVIRDAATLRQAEALFEPQRVLGARQAELGSRQAALGQRQSRLGEEQGRLGARQAGASPKVAQELGRRQNALGEQQNELGRQQNELGREQNRLARLADERMRALLADAIRRGVAQRVD